jgi:predicted transcriptional regulator
MSRKNFIMSTVKALKRIMEQDNDPRIRARARKMYAHLALPMSLILKKVPGVTITDKAKVLGVNRATWYVWQSGATRPNIEKAEQLARITGYSVAEIRGVESAP